MENEKKYGVFAEIKGAKVFYQVGLTSESDALQAENRLDQQTYKIPEGRTVPVFKHTELPQGERLLCRDGRFRVITPEGKVSLRLDTSSK